MDRKQAWQITRLHQQVTAGTFTEEDVFALLMLLREYSKKGSPVRECADFIAHREKDRGEVFNYLERTKAALDNLGKVSTTLVIQPVFSAADLKACIDSCIAKFNLPPIAESRVNSLLVCVISLLQDVRLVRRDGTPVGALEVAISKDEIILLGNIRLDTKPVNVVFPALVARNDFMEHPESTVPTTIHGVTWASSKDGATSLVQATAG